MFVSTPGGPKAPGREHGLPLLCCSGYSSPRPFPRLCQRGEGSTDIYEFFGLSRPGPLFVWANWAETRRYSGCGSGQKMPVALAAAAIHRVSRRA